MQHIGHPTKALSSSGAPRLSLFAALVAGQLPPEYVRAVTGENIDAIGAADELSVLDPRDDD